nr:hypothetical protein GCM10020093_049660 [Planobispora longispora]
MFSGRVEAAPFPEKSSFFFRPIGEGEIEAAVLLAAIWLAIDRRRNSLPRRCGRLRRHGRKTTGPALRMEAPLPETPLCDRCIGSKDLEASSPASDAVTISVRAGSDR